MFDQLSAAKAKKDDTFAKIAESGSATSSGERQTTESEGGTGTSGRKKRGPFQR